MRIKNKQLKFYVTDEDFEKINVNAASFGLATGTYLRLLGVQGGNPFRQKSEARVALEGHGYEGMEVELSKRDAKKSNRQQKRSA